MGPLKKGLGALGPFRSRTHQPQTSSSQISASAALTRGRFPLYTLNSKLGLGGGAGRVWTLHRTENPFAPCRESSGRPTPNLVTTVYVRNSDLPSTHRHKKSLEHDILNNTINTGGILCQCKCTFQFTSVCAHTLAYKSNKYSYVFP